MIPQYKHGEHKAQQVLQLMEEGQSREEVAEEIGWKDKKTLHIHMTRHGYKWDKDNLRYVPDTDKQPTVKPSVLQLPQGGKESRIIALLEKGKDVREVAKTLQFDDHRQMAVYMAGKGYIWNPDTGNYMKEEPNNAEDDDNTEGAEQHNNCLPEGSTEGQARPEAWFNPIGPYTPALDWLLANREKLQRLLEQDTAGEDKIPRVSIPGQRFTKSVHMAVPMDQLIKDFSREKNIKQNEIFEVALVEFFRKYGFEREIAMLLG